MSTFLVPRDVSDTTATLWIASVETPFAAQDVALAPGSPGTIDYRPWQHWAAEPGEPGLRYRQATITGLRPRTRYAFSLLADGAPASTAQLTTLPAELPLLGEKPFTVLLGSCFSQQQDEEGKVGKTYALMPATARPEVKILCGDQVYLDSPWQRFAMHTHSEAELRWIFFDNYRKTWKQDPGFAQLLAQGANYFSSDDHEYWNNAPNRATVIRDTWPLTDKREEWLRAARELYRAFQTPASVAEISVPPLSVLIIDTRFDRSVDRATFMSDKDLDAVEQWVAALEGPGVLVVGQPVLQVPTMSFSGNFFDWNLPDYNQYPRFSRILMGSRHSLVILTGDVHYGRIARCLLPSGRELVEIISSPMSLIDAKAKGEWEKAPDLFPATAQTEAVGFAKVAVETVEAFAPTDSHFLTLEFTRRGAGVALAVRHWPVARDTMPPPGFGRTVWQHTLQ